MLRRRWSLSLLLVLAVGGATQLSCSGAIPNRDPLGEVFPTVLGESLDEVAVELPSAYEGEPVVLLVGYKQGTQFDIDRWFLGLLQAGIEAPLLEVPTIPGLVPTLISGWIDDGMRSGIPREDWGAVVTLYGSAAAPVAEFTGTEFGRRTRVLVLDAGGQVVWFDDEGYSASKVLEVAALTARLRLSAG